METMPIIENKVDEKWVDAVLRDNARRAEAHLALTPEFGALCIRFSDAVLCNEKYGFKNLDKVTKAEACCRVYLHMCEKIATYDSSKCEAPSNWLYTVAKNRMSQAVNEIFRGQEVSEAVAVLVGTETLSRLEGIDRNAPVKRIMAEKIEALKDFKLDKRAKECLFRQSWRGNWFKRDGLDVLERAKRHRRMHAAKVAVQASIPEAVRTGLVKLLEDRKNGRN